MRLDMRKNLEDNNGLSKAILHMTCQNRLCEASPLGFYGGDTNLYRFVGDDPENKVDPSGLYEEDVHFYMTYYMASAVGLDKYNAESARYKKNSAAPTEAWTIAWADQYVDDYSGTDPTQLFALDVRRKFHFRTSGARVKAGSSEAAEIVNDGIATGNPILAGIGLHAYQDSWSHEGFTPQFGHADCEYGGHGPDYPWKDPAKAMRMAKATYDKLVEYMKKNHPNDPIKLTFDDIKPTLEKLFKQSGGIDVTGGTSDKSYKRETESRAKAWLEEAIKKNIDNPSNYWVPWTKIEVDRARTEEDSGYIRLRSFIQAVDSVKLPGKR